MNSAYVFKKHSLISKNECVRIPDDDIEPDVTDLKAELENADNPSAIADAELIKDTAEASISEMPETCSENPVCADENTVQEQPKQIAKADNVEKAASTANAPDKEVLSQLYKKELDELSRAAAQAAAQSAYFDALNKKKSELKECITNVQTLLNELTQRHEEFVAQYTSELKYMAVDIAEKMILEKISTDDSILQKLVLSNVKAVKNADWIGVELSEQLVSLVDHVKKELEAPEYRGRASVHTVSGKLDTFRVTTDEGTLVSTISVQAENLRRAFGEAE